MTPVTQATRLPVRDYIVHRRTGTETATVHVQATGVSAALVTSGLGTGWVHDANAVHCDSCVAALTAEAVTR